MMNLPQRKLLRLRGYDYSQSNLYFITICEADKSRNSFGRVCDDVVVLNEIGEIVKQCWLEIPSHFTNVKLHEFIVMPNHVHGIIEIVGANNHSPKTNTTNENKVGEKCFVPAGTSRTIGSIVRGFKIGVTKQIGYSIWQRNYYDTIIRSTNEYTHISTYIIQNPKNWGNKIHHK